MRRLHAIFGVLAAVLGCGDALAQTFGGIFTQNGPAGIARAEWPPSEFGPSDVQDWGLAFLSGPHTGFHTCTATRDFGPFHISSTVSGTLPAPEGTPTTIPMHLEFDFVVNNTDTNLGMGATGGVYVVPAIPGPRFFRMNFTATYDGSAFINIAGGEAHLGVNFDPPIILGIIAPGTTITGVRFGSGNQFDVSAFLRQGQHVAGQGHLNVRCDVFFSDTPFPPAEPALISPVNGASNQSVAPLLEWSPTEGATSFTVRIADNPLLSNPIHTASGLTGTTYSVPASTLAGCTQYWWGVSAENAFGSSASIPVAFTFTTAPESLLTASLSGAEPYLTCPGGTIVASAVASGAGAYGYQWQAKLDGIGWFDLAEGSNPSNGSGGAFNAAGVASESVTITGLADAPEDFPFSSAIGLRCVVSTACDEVTTEQAEVLICPADYDCNGFPNGDDFDLFMEDFYYGNLAADVDGNTFVNGDDFDYFLERFFYGC